jgi:hypothetical protein
MKAWLVPPIVVPIGIIIEAVRLIKERGVTVRRPRAIWVCMGRCSATG